MYTLMIVEDEELIREGMKGCLDWSAYGIELIGDAADGRMGLDMAVALRPDIILTDVVMAEMDGIEFVRRLRTDIPDKTIRVVMISGHEDVEYIKSALKLQVVDYLLKPFHTEELEDVLRKVLQDCGEERARSERLSSLERHVGASRQLVRERFLQELMDRELDDTALTAYREVLGDDDTVLDALTETEAESVYSAAYIETDGDFPAPASTPAQDGELPLLLFDAGGGAHGAIMAAEPHEMAVAIGRLLPGHAARIGIGASVARLADIRHSFRQARLALLGAQADDGDAAAVAVYEAARAEQEEPLLADIAHREAAILAALERGDRAELQHALLGFAGAVRRAGPHAALPYLQAFGSMLLLQVARRFGALLEVAGAAAGEQTLAGIRMAYSERELERLLAEALDGLAAAIHSKPDRRKVVLAVEEYMQRSFREELSLAQLAAHVHLSPNYLAGLYKKETGATVNDALTQLRLEEAKRLLREEPGLLIADLAERVGYKDGKYFTKLFKREVGINPSEYREKAR
ncbi:response regulator [Paenibacillus koleovorans]|uniref:response regulator n=1 Tax=Paenibacillus koleovorans TaxID=121608 RepID=UPI000FD9C57B|nr:response regulator [Paenibacillus koleovorans]